MSSVALEQCQCGRPLHPYWVRERSGKPVIFTQKPIIPGPSRSVWAADATDISLALGLQSGEPVHDVHVADDRAQDHAGACLSAGAPAGSGAAPAVA